MIQRKQIYENNQKEKLRKKRIREYLVLRGRRYKVDIVIGANCRVSEFESFLKRRFKDDKSSIININSNWSIYKGSVIDTDDLTTRHCIWVEQFDRTNNDRITLLLEVFHIIERILPDRDIYELEIWRISQ